MPTLNIRLLGDFLLTRDDEPVTTLNSPRLQSLFTYLLLHRDAPQPREHVAFQLWPDSPEARARGNLRRLIHRLRRSLPEAGHFLDLTGETLQWQAGAPFTLDVAGFERAVSQHELARLQEAVALYQGDLLPGCYEDWILPERQRLHDAFVDGLERLIALLEAQRDYRAAIRYARRLLQHDPLREETYRTLMRLHARCGDRAGALNVYHNCTTVLQAELGVQPGPATQALYQHLLQLDEPALARPPGDAGGEEDQRIVLSAWRHNLPAQPTPFIGRETELAQLAELLDDPDCRLLTLVGAGGIGKTRLALEAAARKVGQFRHGVYQVSLAPLDSSDRLASAIADALQFSFQREKDPKAQLLDYLRGKEMLLVLDNFEHLLPPPPRDDLPAGAERARSDDIPRVADHAGVDLVVEITANAPRVKIVVTSRERLNLRWEWSLAIDGLDVPESEAAPELESYSAVTLFLQAAQRAHPGLTFSTQALPVVARICRLVAGMPLAIELAAAWVRTHTPQEIAQHIAHSPDFLVTSLRDVPERHRSWRAVFVHSWDLLAVKEQGVLKRLSVFRGGFEGEAAEEVAAGSPALLASLVDKSFLRRDSSGRYDIHELLKQYIQERLARHAREQQESQDRHRAYYAAFLHQQHARLRDQTAEALETVDREIENVRTAWGWMVSQGAAADINRSLESLFLFYELQSRFQEGAAAFKAAREELQGTEFLAARLQARQAALYVWLARYQEATGLLQQALSVFRAAGEQAETAFALKYLGEACWKMGDYARARLLIQESHAIYAERGERREVATTLNSLGTVAHNLGQYAEAQPLLEQSLAILKGTSDRWGIATTLHNLAQVAYELGDYTEAQRRNEQSLAMRREIGDQWGIAASLNNLGIVFAAVGAYERAKACYRESLAIRREIGDRWGMAAALNNLGVRALNAQAYAEARQHYQDSLAICREIGDRRGTAIILDNLGLVAYHQGAYAEAHAHHLQALAIFREIGNLRGMTFCLAYLGYVTYALGEYRESRAYFDESLHIAQETGAASRVVDGVLGIATLLAQEGKHERALELAALVRHHPAGEQATKDTAEHLVSDLVSQLPAEVAANAQARGRATPLEMAVKEILAS